MVLVGDGAADVCDGVEEFCYHLVYPERDGPSPLWTARGLAASQKRYRTKLSADPLVQTKAPAGAYRLW